MKNFDLEAAKKGAKVCTREGWAARILCFDFNKGRGDKTIVAELLVMPADDAIVECYYASGAYYETTSSGYDLMMADDDYLEKLERGEYDRPDHIGEATEKVDWDYWRRMYAGMALQGLVASDKWRRMEMGDRVCVCVEMADALIEELKKEKK